MRQSNLSACVATVPLVEPRDSRSKIAAAEAVLDFARHFDHHVAVFPAALLLAESDDDVPARARGLLEAARARGVGIVFGVDARRSGWLIAWAPGMGAAELWRDDAPVPLILRLGRFRAAVLSGRQIDEPKLRAAAARARPNLVIACARMGLEYWSQALGRFRRLGVPVVASSYTVEPEVPVLVCPRGYRLPNVSSMERGFMVGLFDVSVRDGAGAAAAP